MRPGVAAIVAEGANVVVVEIQLPLEEVWPSSRHPGAHPDLRIVVCTFRHELPCSVGRRKPAHRVSGEAGECQAAAGTLVTESPKADDEAPADLRRCHRQPPLAAGDRPFSRDRRIGLGWPCGCTSRCKSLWIVPRRQFARRSVLVIAAHADPGLDVAAELTRLDEIAAR